MLGYISGSMAYSCVRPLIPFIISAVDASTNQSTGQVSGKRLLVVGFTPRYHLMTS